MGKKEKRPREGDDRSLKAAIDTPLFWTLFFGVTSIVEGSRKRRNKKKKKKHRKNKMR